mmetsp:Transcript_82232/g.255357  ORF Transcript_82232/g.255357 Transcript_82232/m.255357 type:complete len:205 (-) Transcript_82232:169-783(-)
MALIKNATAKALPQDAITVTVPSEKAGHLPEWVKAPVELSVNGTHLEAVEQRICCTQCHRGRVHLRGWGHLLLLRPQEPQQRHGILGPVDVLHQLRELLATLALAIHATQAGPVVQQRRVGPLRREGLTAGQLLRGLPQAQPAPLQVHRATAGVALELPGGPAGRSLPPKAARTQPVPHCRCLLRSGPCQLHCGAMPRHVALDW